MGGAPPSLACHWKAAATAAPPNVAENDMQLFGVWGRPGGRGPPSSFGMSMGSRRHRRPAHCC